MPSDDIAHSVGCGQIKAGGSDDAVATIGRYEYLKNHHRCRLINRYDRPVGSSVNVSDCDVAVH